MGEFTQARSYQVLLNIKAINNSTMVRKKKHSKHRYLELRVDCDDEYVKDMTYTLSLQYNVGEDYFKPLL